MKAGQLAPGPMGDPVEQASGHIWGRPSEAEGGGSVAGPEEMETWNRHVTLTVRAGLWKGPLKATGEKTCHGVKRRNIAFHILAL